MTTETFKSYAKINLSLNVEGKREDGYHNLDLIMVPIELHDSIHISKLSKSTDNYVTVDDFSLGLIEYNLASYAIDVLKDKYHFKPGFRMDIHKNIPMQAGLGGGSSNAAFTMLEIRKMLKLNINDEELIRLATPLGADVPFFIKCKPMRCCGVGEKMTPITIKNDYYVLLVKPKEGCSTRDVFSKFDGLNVKAGNIDNVVKALETGDDDLLSKSIFNVLETPAMEICPEIKKVKDALLSFGLKIVLMTGSGSTVFALSTNKKELAAIQRHFENDYWTELTKIIK